MIKRPTLYLESTIPSYLAAKPSRDLLVAGHQQVTRDWWEGTRLKFDIYSSQVVIDEISAGDSTIASERLKLITGISLLRVTGEVENLASHYLDKLGLPTKASLDILHLAYSVAYELDYLLTWNCAHLANGIIISRLQKINGISGLKTPIILTPEELLELPKGG